MIDRNKANGMGDSTLSSTELEIASALYSLAMRKAELEAKDLTWDQMYVALIKPVSASRLLETSGH